MDRLRRLTNQDLASRLSLIVIAERRFTTSRDLLSVIQDALDAGAPAVQLRNKGDSAAELLATAHTLREMTRAANALFFVNDRLDVALASSADGVHLGPNDIPVAAARAVVPDGCLIGRSADDPRVALQAVADGASYIGCGTVYATSTKADAGEATGVSGLRSVAQAVTVPVVGIGGITPQRATDVRAAGASGVAVVGAIMAADDPARAVRAFLAETRVP